MQQIISEGGIESCCKKPKLDVNPNLNDIFFLHDVSLRFVQRIFRLFSSCQFASTANLYQTSALFEDYIGCILWIFPVCLRDMSFISQAYLSHTFFSVMSERIMCISYIKQIWRLIIGIWCKFTRRVFDPKSCHFLAPIFRVPAAKWSNFWGK